MNNWSKIEEGTATLIHHSTSCVVELQIKGDDFPQSLWMDYSDLLSLVALIKNNEDAF